MPTISMFYGIRIFLYYDEHNPPHFHAEYQGHKASYDMDGNKTRGTMPRKQDKIISAWAVIHSAEIMDGWNDAQRGDVPRQIEPLR